MVCFYGELYNSPVVLIPVYLPVHSPEHFKKSKPLFPVELDDKIRGVKER